MGAGNDEMNRLYTCIFQDNYLSLHPNYINMKVHEVIISLASNENQEKNLAKAREQLTQLMGAYSHLAKRALSEPALQRHDGFWRGAAL